jgi:transposase
VAAMLQALMDQTTADVKIAALTHELAYYKRIRFSTKSEALAPLQRDVFEETWNTDISAIEAEVEQLQGDQTSGTVTQPSKRPRAGRKMLLHFLHSPHPCGLSAILA